GLEAEMFQCSRCRSGLVPEPQLSACGCAVAALSVASAGPRTIKSRESICAKRFEVKRLSIFACYLLRKITPGFDVQFAQKRTQYIQFYRHHSFSLGLIISSGRTYLSKSASLSAFNSIALSLRVIPFL